MPTSPGCAGPWTGPTSSTDPRFSTLALRAQHGDEINDIVAEWTVGQSAEAIEAACIAHDVPVGTAYSAADIFADPHMAARGDLVSVEDPVVGPIRQQAPFPRYVGRPTPVPTGAPRLGADNQASGATWWGCHPRSSSGCRTTGWSERPGWSGHVARSRRPLSCRARGRGAGPGAVRR